MSQRGGQTGAGLPPLQQAGKDSGSVSSPSSPRSGGSRGPQGSTILGTSPRGPWTDCHRWLFLSAQVPAGARASRLGREEREAGQQEGAEAQGEKGKELAFAHSPPRPHPGLALWGRALLSFPELSSWSDGRGEGLLLANLSNPPPLGAASRLAQASESLVQGLFNLW